MPSIVITVLGILVGLLCLGLMMFLHEFGHYYMGKKLGFNILEFSIFMGPRLFSWEKNGIRYSLKAIPIGASVQFAGEMLGEEEQPEEIPECSRLNPDGDFQKRPRWARALVLLAGPAMNILSAVVAFFLLYSIVGYHLPVVNTVAPASVAESLSLQPGDRIVSLANQTVRTDLDLRSALLLYRSDQPIELAFEREGKRYERSITPVSGQPVTLGITLQSGKQLLEAGKQAVYVQAALTRFTFRSIGKMLVGELRASENLSGPVGVVAVLSQSVTTQSLTLGERLLQLLSLFAILSFSLGFMNLLPIPPLDGSHLLILLVEGCMRRNLAPKFRAVITYAGLLILLALFAAGLYFDLQRLLT